MLTMLSDFSHASGVKLLQNGHEAGNDTASLIRAESKTAFRTKCCGISAQEGLFVSAGVRQQTVVVPQLIRQLNGSFGNRSTT